MSERRRIGRAARIALAVLAVVIGVPVVAAVVLALSFNPDQLKPEIAEIVHRQTGRELALTGPVSLKLFSLAPAIEMRNLALANLPGGSRPAMMTLDRLEAQVDLLPLIRRRVEIGRLVLIHPDILLETVKGQPNWHFAPESKQANVPQQPQGRPGAERAFMAVSVLQVKDGKVAYRDHKGRVTTIEVPSFETKAASAAAPISVSGDVVFNGVSVVIAGELGSFQRLQQRGETKPWPVQLTLVGAGARVGLLGSLTEPLQGRGYDVKLDGTIEDLSRFDAFAPKARLPSLHDIAFSGKVTDSGTNIPQVGDFTVRAGASALDAIAPGLKLTKLAVTMATMDEPLRVEATGSFSEAPLTISASTGPVSQWRKPGSAVPVEMNVQAAAATASAKGTVSGPGQAPNVELALAAHVPDVAALSPLAHRPLPSLKNVAFNGMLHFSANGTERSMALQGIELGTPEAGVAGEVLLSLAARPLLRANLTSRRLDVDTLAHAFAAPQTPPAAVPATQTAGPPARPVHEKWVIPDRPLPFGALRLFDADVGVKVNEIRAGGEDFKDFAGHLSLANGHFQIDPFAASLPTGQLALTFVADTAAAEPDVALHIVAPGVPAQLLLMVAGVPPEVRGNLEIAGDLRGRGRTLHELASTLDGKLGIAMVNGMIDTRLLEQTVGPLLRDAKLPNAPAGGAEAVHCLALSLQAKDGTAQVRNLGLATPLVDLSGGGSANLAEETLALHVRLLARLGHTGVIVPMRLTGSFRAPKIAADIAGESRELANTRNAAGLIIGALGGNGNIKGAESPSCTDALAEARQGRAGLMPQAPRPVEQKRIEQSKPPKPADLLRQFMH